MCRQTSPTDSAVSCMQAHSGSRTPRCRITYRQSHLLAYRLDRCKPLADDPDGDEHGRHHFHRAPSVKVGSESTCCALQPRLPGADRPASFGLAWRPHANRICKLASSQEGRHGLWLWPAGLQVLFLCIVLQAQSESIASERGPWPLCMPGQEWLA